MRYFAHGRQDRDEWYEATPAGTRGRSHAVLARRARSPARVDDSVILGVDTLDSLLEACATASGDCDLGVHLGESIARGTFGLFELVSEVAATARDALDRLARYYPLLNDLIVMSVEARADGLAIEQRVVGKPFALGRHANEFFVVAVVSQARRLTGRPVVAREAWFAHGARRDARELERVLGGCPLRFRTDANGLLLAADDASAPVKSSDFVLSRLLDEHAELLLSRRRPVDGFLGQVRSEIHTRLEKRAFALPEIAGALRISQRTLQRRLADEGTRPPRRRARGRAIL